MRNEALGEHTLTVESCDNREKDFRDWLQARIDAEDRTISRLVERIVKAMEAYRTDYPLDTQEADVSVEAAGEYRRMLDRLCSDDLPRFEGRFKELLNENTVREIANFQSQLGRERQTIKERIELINRSLREIDYNEDSGGKSGGQKEKLAYTVLAASLVYQFGLDTAATRSRSFRFVVIDEAFGRGSDESARYGLELFRRLRLQLLIVTPLQKIHVIEPFVAGVGFVHSEDGQRSLLRNLTIEEYRAERAARTA